MFRMSRIDAKSSYGEVHCQQRALMALDLLILEDLMDEFRRVREPLLDRAPPIKFARVANQLEMDDGACVNFHSPQRNAPKIAVRSASSSTGMA